ncbi:hypothetical protein [Bacillus badius]|uniref:hypothetical protein n=1 Tax=Bacillus badius TaxID=1455 RepID=UPI0007B394B9|nr:hypothetical protein [Bacillus badius]KZR59370.1 hypothetical protein A3781_13290 [Bacillus badius]
MLKEMELRGHAIITYDEYGNTTFHLIEEDELNEKERELTNKKESFKSSVYERVKSEEKEDGKMFYKRRNYLGDHVLSEDILISPFIATYYIVYDEQGEKVATVTGVEALEETASRNDKIKLNTVFIIERKVDRKHEKKVLFEIWVDGEFKEEVGSKKKAFEIVNQKYQKEKSNHIRLATRGIFEIYVNDKFYKRFLTDFEASEYFIYLQKRLDMKDEITLKSVTSRSFGKGIFKIDKNKHFPETKFPIEKINNEMIYF